MSSGVIAYLPSLRCGGGVERAYGIKLDAASAVAALSRAMRRSVIHLHALP